MSAVRRLYRRSRRLRRLIRRAKDGVLYAVSRAVLALVKRLSLETALRVADRAGDLAYLASRKTRRLALEHLSIAFGDSLSAADRARIARASLRNVARCFAEIAKFDSIRARLDEYVEVSGMEHLRAVHDTGAIVVAGHIGNWELLAAYMALKGIPVAAVARRIYVPQLNRLIVEFRARNGVHTILRESPHASRDILRVLRSKGVLALLIDQDAKVPSISVPFFGRPARTPVAAAALAVRRKLPVFAVFAERRAAGGHRLRVVPLPFACTGDRRRDVPELTRMFNAALEEQIRRNPVEWVWWHRRWRRGVVPRLDLDPQFQIG